MKITVYMTFGQIEGAFVQGIGFFMQEEYLTNAEGLVVNDGTFTYKIPTIDTIPRQFNVEVMNSGHHQKRILSSNGACISFSVFEFLNPFLYLYLELFLG